MPLAEGALPTAGLSVQRGLTLLSAETDLIQQFPLTVASWENGVLGDHVTSQLPFHKVSSLYNILTRGGLRLPYVCLWVVLSLLSASLVLQTSPHSS